MKIIYGIIIILLIILLGACALKAKNKKGNLARIVFLYETGAVLFGITCIIHNIIQAYLMKSELLKKLWLYMVCLILYYYFPIYGQVRCFQLNLLQMLNYI